MSNYNESFCSYTYTFPTGTFCNVIIINLHTLVTDSSVTLVHTQKVRFTEFSGGLLHARQVVPNYLKRAFFQILGMSSICKPDRCLDPIMWFSQFKNEDWGLGKSYLCCLCLPEIQRTHFERARASWCISGNCPQTPLAGWYFPCTSVQE